MRDVCTDFVFFLFLHKNSLKAQQNGLKKNLNIYHFDYIKYIDVAARKESNENNFTEKNLLSIMVSSRAVVGAESFFLSFFFNTEPAKSCQVQGIWNVSTLINPGCLNCNLLKVTFPFLLKLCFLLYG